MELDSKKKSRRDRLMRLKSFTTRCERDRPEESRKVERLSHLEYGNNGRCVPDGRKEMRSPGRIEYVKKKIHARARKMLQHGIGNFVWVSGSGRGEVEGSRKKLSGRERGAKGRVRLHRARDSAELREVASGAATQGLWLRNGKVGSHVSGIDRSRFPGRRTVGKVRRGRRRKPGDLHHFCERQKKPCVFH